MTVEAGKWYRTPEGHAVRADGPRDSGQWHVTYTDNSRWTWPAEQLTLWVPKVGEWVTVTNRDDPGPVRVLRVIDDLAYFSEEVLACAGYFRGECGDPDAMRVEPCLPPAEKISAVVEGEPCGPAVMHANSTCLRCGGPAYLGLQDAECLAPKCEPPAHLGDPPHLTGGVAISSDPRERGWWAWGNGASVVHPTRDGAIRLWREAVRRG